jgi:hypothetical protein
VGEHFDGLRISDPITGVVPPAADPQVEQTPVPVVEQSTGVVLPIADPQIEQTPVPVMVQSTGEVSPATDPQIEQASVHVVVQSVGVEEEEEGGSVEGVTEEDTTMVSGYKADCTELKLIQIFC